MTLSIFLVWKLMSVISIVLVSLIVIYDVKFRFVTVKCYFGAIYLPVEKTITEDVL